MAGQGSEARQLSPEATSTELSGHRPPHHTSSLPLKEPHSLKIKRLQIRSQREVTDHEAVCAHTLPPLSELMYIYQASTMCQHGARVLVDEGGLLPLGLITQGEEPARNADPLVCVEGLAVGTPGRLLSDHGSLILPGLCQRPQLREKWSVHDSDTCCYSNFFKVRNQVC